MAEAVRNDQIFQSRTQNLAFVFQEVLTAIVRLRSSRQTVTDSATFRAQVKEALNVADKEGRKLGYSPDSVRLGVFAVVAFLDETVLNQQGVIFADWPRKPLQEELFGVHEAGVIFFENVRRLLEQPDSAEFADILELHQLCVLLGYRGRYGVGSTGDLRGLMEALAQKIRRVRGESRDLSPAWALPRQEKMPMLADPWGRRLFFAFAGCLAIALLLYIGFRISLGSGISSLRTTLSEVRK